jgi:hypothetical protein
VSPSAFYWANPDSLPGHSRNFLVDARCRFEPTGGVQRKSTVYGLNGHRANFVIALSLGAYEHAIQKSRSFTALFS